MDEKKCDLCGAVAKFDAKLVRGPWAYVCRRCFDQEAVGTPGSYTELELIGTPGREPYAPSVLDALPPDDDEPVITLSGKFHSGVDNLLAIPYDEDYETGGEGDMLIDSEAGR